MPNEDGVRFGVLGPLEVVVRGRSTPIGGLQRRVLLAALLIEANQVVPTTRLIEAVWDYPSPDGALATLRTHVSELRRRLTVPGAMAPLLVRQGGGYVLRATQEQIDEHQARQYLAQGRRALTDDDPVVAAARLDAALRLWRGPALSDVADRPFALPYVRKLDELHLDVLKTKIEIDLALGRHRDVIGDLQTLVARSPYDEGVRRHLALALYRDGRQDEAVRVCREGLEDLHDQGLDSGPLQRLQQEILRGAASLDWTPPRTLDRPSRPLPTTQGMFQLPPDVGDFTGRERPRARLLELLGGDHGAEAVVISAIAGKAGVGKTALAVHVGHQLRSQYPDGALYVDLRGTATAPLEPSRVLIRFLQALGVARTSIPDELDELSELYRAKLAGRRVLVVLDNAANEAQVRPLLPGVEGCAAIVTSRRRLSGLDAAHSVVDVLAPDQAVELLGRLAGRQRVADEPEAAQKIVGLCGYLPLAVRIAGRKLSARHHWPLEKLVQRLVDERDRLTELEVGDLEVRASFSLSYEGRTHEERRAFRLLSLVDAADFSSWVAAALLDLELDEAEDVVDRLADAQLLEPRGVDENGQTRYRFHDLLRVFARERAGEEPIELENHQEARGRAFSAYLSHAQMARRGLVPGGAELVARRGLRLWTARDPEVIKTTVRDPLRWFAVERGNLMSAIVQAHATGAHEAAWLLAMSLVDFFEIGAYWADWRRALELALDSARQARDRNAEAAALCNLGRLATVMALDTASGRLRPPSEEPTGPMAMSAEATARYAEALDFYTQSRTVFADIGHELGEASSIHGQADALTGLGRLEEAMECYDLCLPVFRRSGYQIDEANTLLCIGMCQGEQMEYGDAVACVDASLSLVRDVGHRWLEASAMRRLGELYHRQGRLDQALGCYNESLPIYNSLPDPLYEARTLARRGDILAGIDDLPAARRSWQQALNLLRDLGSPEAAAIDVRLAGAAGSSGLDLGREKLLDRFDPGYYIKQVETSRRLVRMLLYWSDLLVGDTYPRPFLAAIEKAMRNGALVQILLLQPDSAAASQRTEDLKRTVDVPGNINENLRLLRAFTAELATGLRQRLTVRLYAHTLVAAYYRWDTAALVSSLPVGYSSAENTQYESPIESPLAQFMEQRFEELWMPVNSQSMQSYFAVPVVVTSRDGIDRYEAEFVDTDGLLYAANDGLAKRLDNGGFSHIAVLRAREGGRAERPQQVVAVPEQGGHVRQLFEQKYGAKPDRVVRLVPSTPPGS